jgi:hypothetical protein
MKFLLLMHPTPGADRAQMAPVLPAEVRHAWAMYRSGVARELYMREDGKGAVLVLECADLGEAERQASALPLVQAGLARLEIIALAPFAPFESLFAAPAS